MNTMLADREKYPYQVPIPVCPHNIKLVHRRDVETALEIHRKEVQDSIPDEKVSTTLVPELEFKCWKKNGLSLLSHPVGLTFYPKHSSLFITNRLLQAVFIIDMHCPL
ncbi:unnamed protein product [Pocillopora meandrina]|uniref:Uncharacterized protein n=1 Tax=Pocillopora meandrina TaxID=46732 RepID=A0AAU9X1B9_9CNID|nr:unnamed protein product [Pocillopora meandrina]